MKHSKIVVALMAIKAFAAVPTFNSDIAPILYEHCIQCHRPGQVAPFALLTYQDVAKRVGLIATVTQKRLMPPWKAVAGYGHFLDERRLSGKQIDLIRQWAESGAAEGDPRQKPSPPQLKTGRRVHRRGSLLRPGGRTRYRAVLCGPARLQCRAVRQDR